jgi:hypothetical protein
VLVFRRKFILEDAIGSHAFRLKRAGVGTNGIPFGCPLPLTITTVNSVQTMKVPLRSVDGGATWTTMGSCAPVATFAHTLVYSWSGETLVMMGSGGSQTTDHPHAAFLWVSKDDGETWSDETGDIVYGAIPSSSQPSLATSAPGVGAMRLVTLCTVLVVRDKRKTARAVLTSDTVNCVATL